MRAAQSSDILTERRGRVLIVTMNRPDRLNALSHSGSALLREVFDGFAIDDDLLVAILTGAGDRAFSVGNDLHATAEKFASGPVKDEDPAVPFGGITRDYRCPKPIIAAVNGLALGGGFELVLACDLAIAAQHAQFGLPEARRGFVAGLGGVQRLPRYTCLKWAMGLLLTGEPVSAASALAAGLLNDVVPSDQLLDRAFDWAQRIALCSPTSVRLTKEWVHQSMQLSEDDAMARGAEWMVSLRGYEDFYEGPRAFSARRPPVWTGRRRPPL